MISYDDYTSITSLEISLLITFLFVWFAAYYHTTLSPKTGKPDGFGTSTFISNLHSVPLCILAYLSIQQIIPESIPLCYSISFFIIDLLDAVVRKEYIWIIHAVISLVLNVATGWNVKHVKLRSVSKGFFAEASTVCRERYIFVSLCAYINIVSRYFCYVFVLYLHIDKAHSFSYPHHYHTAAIS